MSIENAINKYLEAVKSDVFVRYEKEFSDRIISAISKGYKLGLNETYLVQIVEAVVNNVNNLTMRNKFKLDTKSIFIHGNKSQVEFNYYGQNAQREFGDLIFIISVVYNNRKYFEKITINQFKKDKTKSRSISWSISNKKQLYLLSRFPSFKGVTGLIPKKNYDLPNYSGCLGSYGLLYEPGDFAFVSATRLDSFIGPKNTLKMIELHKLANNRVRYLFDWFPIFFLFRPLPLLPFGWFPVFGNCHFCHDTSNFVQEYLRMNIGEPIFMKIGMDNPQARSFIHEVMSTIKRKAKKERAQGILNFIDAFLKFPYADKEGQNRFNEGVDFDFEGGGIGIIHTIINLGE